jgi:hypothetical protein
MDSDRSWQVPLLIRSTLLGFAAAVLGVAGTYLVGAAAGGVSAVVPVATLLVAFATGLWAGQPDAESLRQRDRWLAAGAVTAVAGAYATFSTIYQQFYPGAGWSLGALFFAIGIPAYALGLLPPTLLAWADHVEDQRDDPAGLPGVVGSLLLGAFLGAAGGSILASFILLPTWTAGTTLMATALLLLIPLTLDDFMAAEPSEAVIYESTTPYGELRVTEVAFPGERQAERRLYLNDEEESGELVRTGAPTLAYVAAAEQWLAGTTRPRGSYLFLGGGAYTLPRRIAERDREAGIVVVELDPEVTAVAYRYFGLSPHHAIRSVHGDARAYLEAPGDRRFDRLYVDVYGGREALPHTLVTVEAAERMRDRLVADGVLAMNVIGNTTGPAAKQVWSVARTFAHVFPTVALYTHIGRDFPDRQNLLLLAPKDLGTPIPRAIGTFELWDRAEWPDAAGAVLYRDLLPVREAAEVVQKPLTPPPPPAPGPRPRERRA